jgi:hypothetical protein
MATPARVNGGALPVVTTGRSLQMFTVGLTNVHVNSSTVDSDFEKLVRAIETIGTVEILGTPAAGAFRVAISGSQVTATSGTGSLQGICNTAVATTTVADFVF